MRRAIAALLLAASALIDGPIAAAPSASASLLVAQGKQKEADGDELSAIKRYSDAIAIDPVNEQAYLALGALRTKRNELTEAEGVYDVAVIRVPASRALFVARGKVRRLRGHALEARQDLRRAWLLEGNTATPEELEIVRELIAVAHEQREPAAELLGWRRLLAIARARGDATLTKEASVQSRALAILVGEIDPVTIGRSSPEPARKSLASVARRGG
jgi:tetratricopeptide (TPR) repeat protein